MLSMVTNSNMLVTPRMVMATFIALLVLLYWRIVLRLLAVLVVALLLYGAFTLLSHASTLPPGTA